MTSESTGQLLLIDPTTDEVTQQKELGGSPAAVATGGRSVWVANAGERSVARFEPGSGTVTSINVGNAPLGVAYGAGAAWAAVGLDGAVVRIDPRSDSVARDPGRSRPQRGRNQWSAVVDNGVGRSRRASRRCAEDGRGTRVRLDGELPGPRAIRWDEPMADVEHDQRRARDLQARRRARRKHIDRGSRDQPAVADRPRSHLHVPAARWNSLLGRRARQAHRLQTRARTGLQIRQHLCGDLLHGPGRRTGVPSCTRAVQPGERRRCR